MLNIMITCLDEKRFISEDLCPCTVFHIIRGESKDPAFDSSFRVVCNTFVKMNANYCNHRNILNTYRPTQVMLSPRSIVVLFPETDLNACTHWSVMNLCHASHLIVVQFSMILEKFQNKGHHKKTLDRQDKYRMWYPPIDINLYTHLTAIL